MGRKYEDVSDAIINGLSQFQGFYSREYFLDLEDRMANMKQKIQESMKEGRLLKIGIVGEVKAGKSSFLNSLIFDGNDVLPKASTPMTAALTKISFSEKTSARIFFYSEKDWERVKNFSREYDREFDSLYREYVTAVEKRNTANAGMGTGYIEPIKTKEEKKSELNEKISLKLISCKELTDMFNRSSDNLEDYLGQEMELEIDDIEAGLHDYIGAEGMYTAIVKHVELKMNNEMLKGVEIVDTPGLNDPIISRGETTKQFLGECDVVFLLSYTSQFLTQNDISFMCETLPAEGIRNIIIVGSKFDSGLLDDNRSKDIKTACNSSKLIYDRQADENIKKCLTTGYNKEVLTRIHASLPPSYISSLLYSSAKKKQKGIPYSKMEQHIITQLKRHFADFEDDEKLMMALSGISQIKSKKLHPVMEAKQEIIAEKNREIISDNKKILLNLLEDINIQAMQNKDDLERYDKDQLEKKLHSLQDKLNTMRREIRNIFENTSVEAEKLLNNMKVNIDLEIDNYIDFDVQTHTHTEHFSCRGGFLGLRKDHYTEEITTYTASVSDVISNMRNYITRCKKYANEEFEKIINIRKLEEQVKTTVIGAFDLSGRDFNENDILIPLEIVIKRIQIPKIDIEVEKYQKFIVDAFSDASVEGENIHRLRTVENRVLGDISKEIKNELDKCRKQMELIMSEQSASFVDNIINQLTANVEMLKNQIDDKENAIRQYNTLLNVLIEYKKMVCEMEM